MNKKLSVVLLIDNEPLYAPYIIRKLIEELDFNLTLKAVVFTEGNYRKISDKQNNQEVNNLYGSFNSFMLNLFYNYKSAVLNNDAENNCFRVLEKAGIEYRITNEINSDEIVDFIKSNEIDILFSLTHHILKSNILNAPKLVCINRHPGKLPNHAGFQPILYTMLEQKDKQQVTITQTMHTMVEKIDAGKILIETDYNIPRNSSLFYGYTVIYKDSVRMFNTAVKNYLSNQVYNQDMNKRKHYSFPNKEICKEFRKLYKIFTWKEYFNNMKLKDNNIGGGYRRKLIYFRSKDFSHFLVPALNCENYLVNTY